MSNGDDTRHIQGILKEKCYDAGTRIYCQYLGLEKPVGLYCSIFAGSLKGGFIAQIKMLIWVNGVVMFRKKRRSFRGVRACGRGHLDLMARNSAHTALYNNLLQPCTALYSAIHSLSICQWSSIENSKANSTASLKNLT